MKSLDRVAFRAGRKDCVSRFYNTGVPRSSESATPWDPTGGLCLGPHGGVLFNLSEVPL